VKSTNAGEQWSSMEKMFLPKTAVAATFNAAISTALIENARRFWEYQENAWQIVADGWFERHRIETQKARETAEKMCRFESFEEVFRTYRDWAIGAFDRILAAARSSVLKIGKLNWSESDAARKALACSPNNGRRDR
jgi:hypothetical protein